MYVGLTYDILLRIRVQTNLKCIHDGYSADYIKSSVNYYFFGCECWWSCSSDVVNKDIFDEAMDESFFLSLE